MEARALDENRMSKNIFSKMGQQHARMVRIEKEILIMQERKKCQDLLSREQRGFIHSNRNETQEDGRVWGQKFVAVLSSDSFIFLRKAESKASN